VNDQAWPSQSEIVIGLVGPVGIDLAEVYRDLAQALSRYQYTSHEIHLTDQLRGLDWADPRLVEEPADERIWSYMSAGNRLREEWDRDDAFALLAINAITLARAEVTGDPEHPADRHAYILRSFKRREEAALLRDIYGTRFVLMSLYSPKESRLEHLRAQIESSRIHPYSPEPTYDAAALVARDEAEADAHGQNVRGIFHEGDFFIDVRAHLLDEFRRILEILFGHPNRTPTRAEIGMFHAVAAARRSAELGRQVGAAICTSEGSVIAVGTNEVPRAGGGLYWEGDVDDAREFTRGHHLNDLRKRQIAEGVAELIIHEGLGAPDIDAARLADVIGGSGVDDLIEFVRAVHAEMAAVTDAARRGISVAGSVLYVTTFPCHHCARHVVAAGIERVIYIAPYAKSLAAEVHADSICVDPPDPADTGGKVAFSPFVGVGPSRFLDLFAMPARKDKATGNALSFEPTVALPRIAEIESVDMQPEVQPYVRRERRAFELLDRIQQERSPRFS
jgi:deoxycytidylate deaminase